MAPERTWWDGHLLGLWVLVQVAAYVVIVVGGVAIQALLARTMPDLASSHRLLATFGIALVGAAVHGFVLGRLQWWILRRRLARLELRRWVLSTFVPAFFVWLLVLAPEAVDVVTGGGNRLSVFRDAFVQALVLGPLIGLSQAAALRAHTGRWAWWFVANLTSYLFGAVMYQVGVWVLQALSVTADVSSAFPALSFLVHGVWMLWVTDPAVVRSAQAARG